ncbi:hypothetical protein BC939DRAFT_456943 [Gamsiella multidivaricata]|uniref:uncharacterized protein n=1 Tax=Gamsiella multidivaricata TaxID=101098 RepID=UPI00221E6E46|nr:uncharacterized protein BC939DRAFT_456943 [Gamsiella multidivaricata]KAG0365832.1 hypothetical protein BGZ54_006165 [Gamsiella multidivaricata]KAI7820787.1 hypothetical protein BC939DRAFT_456943 [Gamsiella multidivaricata]
MAFIRAPTSSPVAAGVRHSKQWRTSPRCLVVALSTSFIIFNWLVFHVFQGRNVDPNIESASSPSYSAPYSANPSASSSGNDPSFSSKPDWLAHWIRWRGLDPGFAEQDQTSLRFDIVYTWVNGSDPELQRLRLERQAQSPLFAQVLANDPKTIDATTTKRFRDMDELRYSVRSVYEYARDMYRHVHILTTVVGPGQGQTPDWLDLTRGTVVRTVHHTTIFENQTYLPSFNSLAIESQMHHIPGVTDVFMYLNDDVFLGTTMLPSDIWTPLYGFVFHMEGSLLVPPTIRPSESNPLNVGEWNSLQYSNFLLSQRFGPRYRAYLAHVPHVLSVPILKEIQAQWPDDFDRTSSHRFRGEGEAKDIQVSFFMAHYVLEKLRETQLESYWWHRLDNNQDGSLNWSEREKLIRLVQSWNLNQQQPDSAKVYHTRPTMIAGHEHILKRVNIPMSGSTEYRLAGLDGYPFLLQAADTSRTIPLTVAVVDRKLTQPQIPYMSYEQPQKRTCRLDPEFCFGSDFMNPDVPSISMAQSKDVFHRLAFKEFHCGDCLLEILMQHPDTGMGAWTPTDERSEAFKDVMDKVARYNYVLGTSDYSFLALQGPESSQKNLDTLIERKNSKAFFCINDDFANDPVLQGKIHGIFKNFLNTRFPTSSPWEKIPPE